MGNLCTFCGGSSDLNDDLNSSKLLRSSQVIGAKELKSNYSLDSKKVLGNGSFGKVFLTQNRKYPDFQVAIKVMDKKKLS